MAARSSHRACNSAAARPDRRLGARDPGQEEPPVHSPCSRERLEAIESASGLVGLRREERDARRTLGRQRIRPCDAVDEVTRSDYRMTEPIRSHTELDRHERLLAKLVEEKARLRPRDRHRRRREIPFRRENILYDVLSDEARQVVVHDDPLVVPADKALRMLELVGRGPVREVRDHRVDDSVVKTQEHRLQLRDDDILVVARVSDDRALGRDALQIKRAEPGSLPIALASGEDRHRRTGRAVRTAHARTRSQGRTWACGNQRGRSGRSA